MAALSTTQYTLNIYISLSLTPDVLCKSNKRMSCAGLSTGLRRDGRVLEFSNLNKRVRVF